MSYEERCFAMLDEPVLVWLGLEFREVVASIGTGAGTAVVAAFILGLGFPGILAGFGVGAMLLLIFRSLRRAGPAYVFSRLYRAGLIDLLPRRLRPSHLLPLRSVARAGRLRLSPVPAEDITHERAARIYFGR